MRLPFGPLLCVACCAAFARAQEPGLVRLERLSVTDSGAGAEVVSPVGREGRRFLVLSSVERALRLFDAEDPRSPRLLWTVPVTGGEPTSVAARADLREIYVAVKRDAAGDPFGFVRVFRDGGCGPPAPDRTYVVGPGPDCVALTPDERTLVVAIEDEDTPWRAGRIELVDLAAPPTTAAVRAVDLGVEDAEPEYFAIDAAGDFVYATLQEQSTLVVADLRTGRVVSRVALAPHAEPDAVALTPDGALLVTANEEGQTLDVFSVARGGGAPQRRASVDLTTLLPPAAPQAAGAAPASRRHALDPEGVACVAHGGRAVAVVGLERRGELWAFDLSDPAAPRFLGAAPAGRTPGARPEVVVRLRDGVTIAAANEGEGTVALFRLVDGPSAPATRPSDATSPDAARADRLRALLAGAADDASVPGAPHAAARNGARLAALVVVDQLGADVLAAARPWLLPDGLRRLEREGASYPFAAYDHACTETAPGHATLGTGATPRVHGIMANDWPDPRTGKLVNAVYDATAVAVGPPSGAKTKGATLARLRAPTFGDALKAAYGPRAQVVSLSLKARSSLLMAGRSADLAAWLDYGTGWWATAAELADELPPFLSARNAADAVAARFDDVWSLRGPPAAYASAGGDASPFERGLDGRNAFPHALRSRTAGRDASAEAALSTPLGNELLLDAVRDAVRFYGLGADDVPDLLCVSFSAQDLIGHQYGSASVEVRDAVLRLDRTIAALLDLFDDRVGRGRWNLALTADHGVGPIPELAAKLGLPAGRIDPQRVRAAAETALVAAFGDPAPARWTFAQDAYHLPLDRALCAARGVDPERAAEIAAAAAEGVPGVLRAIPTRALLARGPRDELEALVFRTLPPAAASDVYVVPQPYHLFSRHAASHGTPFTYDRRVPLVFYGPGVRAAYEGPGTPSPGSAAPTLAAILGCDGPAAADHPPLYDALR